MKTDDISYFINERDKWVDPYDSEDINSRYTRAFIRRAGLFFPNAFYKTGILKAHVWPENLVLLGLAALNEEKETLVEAISGELINHQDQQLYWGLPINWHSGKYIFPKNTLMSTTTAETILFFYEVNEKYNSISKGVMIKAADNLHKKLNRTYLDEDDFLYSYTPLDEYKVYNSNLLVAAALALIGKKYDIQSYLDAAYTIFKVCDKYLPEKGFVPYHFGGTEETADSYHQLFSIRALFYLKNVFPEAQNLYETVFQYFWNGFHDSRHNMINLRPDKKVWDLQPYSEALRVLGLVKDEKGFTQILSSLHMFKNSNGDYIQRIWPLTGKIRIKSKACYSRQGLFRVYAGLSYKYKW